jgi:hypothetical protein
MSWSTCKWPTATYKNNCGYKETQIQNLWQNIGLVGL